MLSIAERTVLGSAIEEAAGCMPNGWHIAIHVEKGAGYVTLYGPDRTVREFPTNHERLSDEIRDALLYALEEDRPATDAELKAEVREYRNVIGNPSRNYVQECNQALAAKDKRIAELRAIIEKHNLCHDLHGKVGRDEFEEGCRRETIKEFGSCGWAEKIEKLEKVLERIRQGVLEYRNQLISQPWGTPLCRSQICDTLWDLVKPED